MFNVLDDIGNSEQDISSHIHYELMTRLQTGNIIIDTIMRSLFIGVFVGFISTFISSAKVVVFYPIIDYVKHIINNGLTLKNGYEVVLEGQSKTNSFMNERFSFSTEFKAVISYILDVKSKQDDCKDVVSMVQFHTNTDIQYDRYTDKESRLTEFLYILNQPKEIKLTDDINAVVNINKVETAEDTKNSSSIIVKNYTITLKSKTITCFEIIEWITQIVNEYERKRKEEFMNNRYLIKFRGRDKDDYTPQWDADTLTSEPSFDTLFFEGKEQVVETIERFLKEKQFYESVGKPWQLGINLSGEPGCGKTSFIRVLAAKLKRNVKDISFSKIKTNKDFEDAIRCVSFEGKSLSPETTIIVAEDIDCANMDAIRTRSNSVNSKTQEREEQCQVKGQEGDENTNHNDELKSDGANVIASAILEERRMEHSMMVKMEKDAKKEQDTLDLSTILNIMDGIKSSNGRIIIFTTNHPDKIDPALLRPGRIDLNIKFGALSKKVMYDMCKFWYSKYAEFYGDEEIVITFDKVWNENDNKNKFVDYVLRPCIIHNVLQKSGANVVEAVNKLAGLCNTSV